MLNFVFYFELHYLRSSCFFYCNEYSIEVMSRYNVGLGLQG